MKAGKKQNSLKPQDVLVLVKLLLWESKKWKYEELEGAIGLSKSECHSAIHRLLSSRLIRHMQGKIKVNRAAMKEFLFFGLPYVFPAKVDRIARGIPVAHGGPHLNKKLVFDPSNVYVWPDPEGPAKGESIVPLYKSAPQAAKLDSQFYELLSIIEALRVGRAREVKMARQYFEDKLSA